MKGLNRVDSPVIVVLLSFSSFLRSLHTCACLRGSAPPFHSTMSIWVGVRVRITGGLGLRNKKTLLSCARSASQVLPAALVHAG